MSLPTYWVGVGAALGIGGIVGFVAGRVSIEKQVRAEYAESVEMLKNTFEKAQSEAPVIDVITEEKLLVAKQKAEKLESLQMDHEPKPFVEAKIAEAVHVMDAPNGEPIMAVPQVVTLHEADYQKAVNAVETPTEVFVSGGVNDYGISFVEDYEYEEDNGFEKYKIDIMMDEYNPTFWMDGHPIDDWDRRLGDSILVDFYNNVPPGVNPVLYVRNHQTGEDYEVVMVTQT